MNASAAKQGFVATLPHADPASAHGVLQLQTSDGPLDLWAAKSDSGGVCWFVDYEADVTGDGPPPGYAGCDPAKIPADGISYSTDWGATHPDRMTVLGRVYVDAATVKVTLLDGSTATLPVAEGLFIGTVAPDAQVASLAAYDAAGNEVAQEVVPR